MERKYTGYLIPKSLLPFPDQIIITDSVIIHRRFKVIGVRKRYLSRNHLSSIYLDKGILFCTIVIQTYNDSIVGQGFTNQQGEEIKSLLGF
jgi:hypothetical protein